MIYADVILPLPLADVFTYEIPHEMQTTARNGFRVIVPFGNRKFYTAIILNIHNNAPKGVEVKEIHSLIDAYPIVNEHQLKLWEWISFYYICPLGDVYKAALPSKLRMESETFVSATGLTNDKIPLTPAEKKIVAFLENGQPEKITKIGKSLNIKNILPVIYTLSEKGVVSTSQTIEQKFTAKTEKYIRLNPKIDKKYIPELTGRAKKQHAVYENIVRVLSERGAEEISRKEALGLPEASASVLKGLTDKHILHEFEVETGRIDTNINATREPFPLNLFQQEAFGQITDCFGEKQTCLLHGVTSSGKTEIYIHLIEKMLAEGKQTLYLVPEIALTTQLTQRLQAVFGDKLGIYHSKINDNERAEIWQKMLSDNSFEIIIGVRSSLFMPFRHLGLVIVDEEHEGSYKQQEPSPRYHARDTAIVLAQFFGANALLGSATPSLESYYNAKTGKYGMVTLEKRFEEIQLPEILLENTKELRRKRKMKSLLAPELIGRMRSALENGEQVILFRNRRGFAPVIECKLCAWTPKCKHCDVSLTYHKFRNQLVCHYCNAVYNMPKACPECKETSLEMLGQGTEQLEEEVSRLFPDVRIARMDTDTTRGKNAYEKIIGDFQENRVQILVGTQMLSKGLDFDNVSVVGIISADSLLNYPDFRSHERGFQLMTQAAGRAGRKNKRGTVIIQTANPEMSVYRFIAENNYEAFFKTQLSERKMFRYPPFNRLISVVVKDRNEQKVETASHFFAEKLRPLLHERVLGPNKPLISKIKLYHIREILLKLEAGFSPQHVRNILRQAETQLRSNPQFKYVVIYFDVDLV